MLSRQLLHVLPSSSTREEEGDKGEGEGHRSTPGATQFYRGAETAASLSPSGIQSRVSSQAQIFDETLRCSPLQPAPLLSKTTSF